MKRIMCILLSSIIVLSVLPNRVKADVIEENAVDCETSDILSYFVTDEAPVPKRSDAKNENDYLSQLSEWKKQTFAYLEKHYNQKIICVEETDQKITIVFERNMDGEQPQIIDITYAKPIDDRANVGDTKVTTLDLGWDQNGQVLQQCDFKSASNMLAAGTIVISLVPGVNVFLSTFISTVAWYVGWSVDNYLPVQGKTEYVSYTERKVGWYYLSSGGWYPNVQIGKHSYWYYKTAFQPEYSGGPYIPHHDDNIPNSNHSNPSKVIKKSHYDDDTWILNKSAEIANGTNVYYDL